MITSTPPNKVKPDLILLTNEFPNATSKSEDWLNDEIRVTWHNYNTITIIPQVASGNYVRLPDNCQVADLNNFQKEKLSLAEMLNCIKIVWSDLPAYSNKKEYSASFRYNFSLIKNLHLNAKKISRFKDCFKNKPIVYAYWADNLATTACIIKQMYKSCKVVTRGHGFEIFEEQTKNNVVPFRIFQYKYLNKIFADSKKGLEHLNLNKNKAHLNAYSYVGTKDLGISLFDSDKEFTIVTCSHIRNIKRLHLMADILKHVTFNLTWHVLGDGADLPLLKESNSKLPLNIKVIYHGYLKNEEILNFYKNNSINLFASLSYSEGLPVTMMEAQSFGIPIMSTDVGGCKEICNELTGFLIEKNFDPKNTAALITAFKDAHKNSFAFRKQCRKFWEENFNAETNYMKFSKDVLAL
ncbi:MAG: glycosyl transferase group 1 [Bacteroidetes bacterium]|nr:glycosyl transferase group 1 [Bacteroidota bacterium]